MTKSAKWFPANRLFIKPKPSPYNSGIKYNMTPIANPPMSNLMSLDFNSLTASTLKVKIGSTNNATLKDLIINNSNIWQLVVIESGFTNLNVSGNTKLVQAEVVDNQNLTDFNFNNNNDLWQIKINVN